MSLLGKLCLLLLILPLASAGEMIDPPSDLSPRSTGKAHLECEGWRTAIEANKLGLWRTIPKECVEYVEAYMTGKDYECDLQRVSDDAGLFARSVNLSGDGKDAWIFDVDETLLSNLPYYAQHGYGLEIYDSTKFDRWVETGMAPAIELSLRLYEEVLKLGFKVILLTGRSERHRNITAENLSRAGVRKWDKLILRSLEDQEKSAVKFKSGKRNEFIKEGYRLIGNSGDQWSDVLGPCMSTRSFKLPNPMYYIP